jgi:membrane protein
MLALLKETWSDWRKDKASRLAAALAFYTAVSLAPLTVVVLAVTGFLFGNDALHGRLAGELSGLVGPQAAAFIQEVVQSASNPKSGVVATVLGVVTLLLGASGVVGQLQDALNTVWNVEPPQRGFWGTVRERFLSLTLVFGVGFLLTVSLVLSAGLSAFSDATGLYGPVLHEMVSVVVFTLLFGMMFKMLPDVKVAWRDVFLGALVTAVLFTLGKILIGLYLGHSAVGSSYGAAGALVVLLLWLYYSAQILFLGAEFTQVYSRRRASLSGAPSARTSPPWPEAVGAAPAARSVTSGARARRVPTIRPRPLRSHP